MPLKSKFLAFKKKGFQVGGGGIRAERIHFLEEVYPYFGRIVLYVHNSFCVSVTHRSPINFLLFLVSLGPMRPRQFFSFSVSFSHQMSSISNTFLRFHLYSPSILFCQILFFRHISSSPQMKYCVSLPFFRPNIAGRLGEWYLYLVFFICICSVFGPHDS